MTTNEAINKAFLALDALCVSDYGGYELSKQEAYLVDEALSAIKKSLGPPVAWMYKCREDGFDVVITQTKKDWAESGSGLWTEIPLFA